MKPTIYSIIKDPVETKNIILFRQSSLIHGL